MITLDDRIRHAGKLVDHLGRGIASKAHHEVAERAVIGCILGLARFRAWHGDPRPAIRAECAQLKLAGAWRKAERDLRRRLRETG